MLTSSNQWPEPMSKTNCRLAYLYYAEIKPFDWLFQVVLTSSNQWSEPMSKTNCRLAYLYYAEIKPFDWLFQVMLTFSNQCLRWVFSGYNRSFLLTAKKREKRKERRSERRRNGGAQTEKFLKRSPSKEAFNNRRQITLMSTKKAGRAKVRIL